MNEAQMLKEIDRLSKENDKLKKEKDDEGKKLKGQMKKAKAEADDAVENIFRGWSQEMKDRDVGYKAFTALRDKINQALELPDDGVN